MFTWNIVISFLPTGIIAYADHEINMLRLCKSVIFPPFVTKLSQNHIFKASHTSRNALKSTLSRLHSINTLLSFLKINHSKKSPAGRSSLPDRGFTARFILYCCDYFYLTEYILRKCLNCDTGTCRFVYEIFCVYFVKCGKIVHVCKKAYSFDCFLIAGTCCLKNCTKILHYAVCLLLDGCSHNFSGCRVNRDLTGCVKSISMDDCLGLRSDGCRCLVCMYCLHNKNLLS